jgi:uracil permease
MEKNLVIGIQEKPSSISQWLVLSLQHVFAMFGATVLVPLLTGLDVGVALVASGVGTLIYIACTKGKVPVYLGSSFAYIGAISVAGATNGFSSAYVGLMVVGIIYAVVATIIRFTGNGWIKKLLPPVVVGPVIIIIGLSLANVAISSSGFNGGQGWQVPVVAIITFFTVVFIGLIGKGFFRIVPFLIAILVGYIFSVIFQIVDLSTVFDGYAFIQAPAFQLPFVSYALDFDAILMFAPIAFVTIAEHIGDHTVLGEICEEDFIADPGLENTLMGDGIATFVSAAIGGPANTTYGENTGVVAMTKVGSVYVTGLAAIFAVCLGFFGYIQAFINSIPWAVIGGMTIVLYGLIAGNGVKVLIKAKVNLGDMRNLIIVATMLVIGLGGASIPLNDAVALQGMSLAVIVGVGLNALFNWFEHLGLMAE